MSEALFRVGGVYRNGLGAACKMTEDLGGHARVVIASSGLRLNGSWSEGSSSFLRLIPGELIERDGQWVPADTIKMVGRVDAGLAESFNTTRQQAAVEPQRAPLPESDAWRYTGPKAIGGFTTFGADWRVYSDPTTSGFAPTPALVKFTCVDCRGCSKCAPFKGTLHAHPGKGSALLRG